MAKHKLEEQLVDWSRCEHAPKLRNEQPLSCSTCRERRMCPGYSDFIDYRREECVPRLGTVNVEKVRRLVYKE